MGTLNLDFQGFQYAAYYDASTSSNASVRYVSMARRDLSAGNTTTNASSTSAWEKLTLTDYNQTLDDGHDMYGLFFF